MSHSKAHPRAQPILPALHALYIELPRKTMPGGPGKGFNFLLWQVLMALHTHRAAEAEQELLNTLPKSSTAKCSLKNALTLLSALIQVL